MALVTAARLNRYMNSPAWSSDQEDEAAEICKQVEDRLSARLNTPLTPIPFSERVAILATGLVATKYPVFSVSAIDGVAIGEDDPLPTGWTIQDNRLRATATSAPSAFTLGSLLVPSLGMTNRVDGVGAVSVDYLAGWGPKKALIDAILNKGKAVMTNRHDDTVIARELDATAPPPEDEDWTDDEINKTLGIYRNLVIFR
jgi:hypothetical protein